MQALATAVRRIARGTAREHGPCLDELSIAALAEGSAASTARTTAIEHLSQCDACRAQLADVCAALRDPALSAAIEPLTPRRRTQPRTGARGGLLVTLAAAAVVAFAIGLTDVAAPGAGDPVLRDDTVTDAASRSPSTLAPLGAVTMAEARILRWSTVPGADAYRVTVFTDDGTVMSERLTADTTAAMSASAVLVPGFRYFWKVEARTSFDRWVGSGLAEFRVFSGGSRP